MWVFKISLRNFHAADTSVVLPEQEEGQAHWSILNQHPLGNSDLKTSSELEQNHKVCRTGSSHLLLNICSGYSLLLKLGESSQGEFSWGGHVAFALFLFSRKRFEAFSWEPPLRKSPFHLVHPCFPRTELQAGSQFMLQHITLQLARRSSIVV